MTPDLKRFSAALKDLRERRGLSQEKVASLVPERYSDGRAYRRMENAEGKRAPERDAIVDVLVKALREVDAGKIDGFLWLAGYDGLTDEEVAKLALKRLTEPALPAPVSQTRPSTPLSKAVGLACGAGAIGGAFVLLSLADGKIQWFGFFTSLLYASLYGVSIFLETAYQATTTRIWNRAIAVSCLILLTSSVALALDASLVKVGNGAALWLALAIFLITAAVQWIVARSVLVHAPLTPAKFQTLTPPAAHLKNTAYFLLPVILFWLPPFHCIARVRQEIALGHGQLVSHFFDGGAGGLCPKPLWLWAVFLVVIGVSIPMGAHLLDDLEPNPRKGRFLEFFYARLILFVTLCVVCLAWYSTSTSSLVEATRSSP